MADEKLLELAAAVADGASVDWAAAEAQAADASERAVVRELRVLATLAEVAGATGPPPVAPPADVPASWGHLRDLTWIGEGSFGTVYRAWESQLERTVALKLAKTSMPSSFNASRARSEARLLARVRHPHVVSVYGADTHDGRFGLWMEYIYGQTLEQIVLDQGPLSGREAAAIGIDLCSALAAVHRARLLHRDLKASNVMREHGGRIVLMDFGTGRVIPAADEPVLLAGTPLYLAPEVLGGQKPSVQSDIYSLGVLLYYLVTARFPVEGATRGDVVRAHAAGGRTLLRDARPDVLPAVADVIERALAADPRHRYASAGRFADALAAAVGQPPLPDPAPWRHWKWPAAVLAAGLVAAVSLPIVRSPATSVAPIAAPAPAADAAPTAAPAYEVGAAFFASRAGQDVRLDGGSRVAPGDRLFLQLDTSRPVYVYVINHDERGESYLVFPLPGYEPANPVPAGRTVRLPGTRGGEPHYWEVTSAGGREHFFVYVSADRLTDLEQLLAALPRAEVNRPVLAIPSSTIGTLRGVGGLAAAGTMSSPPTAPSLLDLQPLPSDRERTTGVWARRITFDNPVPAPR